MAKPLTYNATLTERVDLEPGLAVFYVEPDQPVSSSGRDEPGFIPGQYLTIGLNDDPTSSAPDRPPSVTRPMSIASSPKDPSRIEFYIRYVNHPESTLPLTHLLWKQNVGARMYLRPVATGRFTLEGTAGDEDKRVKLLVAAGTGLAPFVSIARDRVDHDQQLEDLIIAHGASHPSALGYRTELMGLEKTHGLRYVPTVSRAQAHPDWSGEAGRVEALFGPDRLANTERLLSQKITPDGMVILVCGLVGTIAECIKHLVPRGFVPHHRRIRRALGISDEVPANLFYEQYDSNPVIDLKDAEQVQRLADSVPKELRA